MKNKGLWTMMIAASLTSVCALASCSTKLAAYPVEVSFDLNFETSASAPGSISLNAGEAYGELPTVTVENEGYHFAGWNTRADGEGRDITEESSVNVTMGDHTLYAMWEGNEYNVVFDLNGGNINGVTQISSKAVTYGEMYGTLVIPSTPSISMKKFKGWYLNPEGEGEKITASSMVREAKDHTVYAVYKDFKFNYVFDDPADVEDFYSMTGGLEYKIAEGENGNYLEISDTGTTPTGNMVLDMPLTAGTTIELDVEFDGVVDDVTLDDAEKVKAGFFCYGAMESGMPIKSGALGKPGEEETPDYVNKWYWGQGARNDPWESAVWNDGHMQFTISILEDCYGMNMYIEFGRKAKPNETPDYDTNMDLWKDNKWRIHSIKINYVEPPQELPKGTEVNINFDWNYDTDIAAPATITAIAGEKLGDVLPDAHVREGCDFKGWNDSPDGRGKTYNANRTLIATEEEITLYAIWEGYEYSLFYDLQGGQVDGASSLRERNVIFGKAYGKDALPTPTKAGATFLGWFFNAEGNGEPVTKATLVNVAADHKLYAVYIQDVESIQTFDFSDPAHALYFKSDELTSRYVSDANGGYLEISNDTAQPSGHLVLMKPLKAGTTVEVDMEFIGEVDPVELDVATKVKAGAFFYGVDKNGNSIMQGALGDPNLETTLNEVKVWYWGQGARNDAWEKDTWNDGHMQFTVNVLEDAYGINIMLEFGKKTENGTIVLDKSLWENNKWRINSLVFNIPGIETEYAFALNGGNVDGATALDSVKAVTGDTYGALPIPKKEGATFMGWYTNPDGTGAAVAATTVINNQQAHTLYAIWKEVRCVYDFTTEDQLADIRDLEGNGVYSLETDGDGSYLKISTSDTSKNDLRFVLENVFLAAGSKVTYSVEFVGEYSAAVRAGIFVYGAKPNGSSITSGALGTPGVDGTPEEVNKWYWGQGYHSNDSSRLWNGGKFTYEANILEDCYGVHFLVQLGTDTANGYWKITEIKLELA